MRIEIYNDEPAEKVLRVRLERRHDTIALGAVRANGEWDWTILQLTRDGKVHRCTGVGKDTGLDLDERGRIKLTEE